MDIQLPTWPAKLMVPLALSVLWLRLVAADLRLRAHDRPSGRRAHRGAQADHHRDAGAGRDRRGPGPRGRTMMELSPLTIGGLGVAALLVLCFAGVRFAFAGALVGTAGLIMLIGWDAGIRTAGIAPYTAGRQLHAVRPADVHPDRLPRLLRRHHPDRLRGGATMVRLAARRPRHRHGVRGRGLLGGLGREQRGRGRVRQGGDPRDAAGEVRQAPGRRRLRRRRHARFADPAQHAAGGLRHHHRAVDRQAADRRLRARHRVGAGLRR